jgi:ribose transport system substrate-binding protein
MKKSLDVFFLLAVLFCVLAGCTRKKENVSVPGSIDRSKLEFTFVAPMLGNDYWDGVIRGVNEAAVEQGVNVNIVAPGANFDLTVCIDLLDAAIASGVDGIIMGAYDADAVIPGFQKAKDAGIPVVTVDCDSPNSTRYHYAGTSNYNAGYFAGKTMAERTGGKANIGILTGGLAGDSAVGRINGFKDAIKDYPDMKILATEVTDEDALIAVQKAEAMISTYPEMNAVFGVRVYDGPGVGTVVAERGIKNFFIIGFDEVNTMMDYIRQGICYGTLVQNTNKMGRLGVEMLVQIIEGNPPAEEIIDTGIILVTKDNIDELGY